MQNTTSSLSNLPRVLVVEDHLVNQRVVQSMLKRFGFESDVAENGQQALEMIQQGQYVLVLMDCQMPVMDGYAATTRIRELESEGTMHKVPVIALTANALTGDKERCLNAGMDDFLAKPIKLETLKEILDKWCPVSDSAVGA